MSLRETGAAARLAARDIGRGVVIGIAGVAIIVAGALLQIAATWVAG